MILKLKRRSGSAWGNSYMLVDKDFYNKYTKKLKEYIIWQDNIPYQIINFKFIKTKSIKYISATIK